MKKVHLVILFILSFVLTKGQILTNTSWESGNVLQNLYSSSSLPYYPGYSAQIDSSVARVGSKSVRFILHDTDQLKASGRRSELTLSSTNPLNPQIRWYAFSEYLPANYVSDVLPEIHFQVADNSGLTAPNLALWLTNNRWYVNRKYNIGAGNVEVQTEITGGSLATLGGWNDWRIYYKQSIGNDGQIIVYRNGVQVFSHNGPNANAVNGVMVASRYPKFGIYKWRWNNPGTYNPKVRILYFDAVMYGDSTATLSTFNLPNPLNINFFSPTSGITGTQVSISGSGFTGASSVKFGATSAASYTVANDSLIQATVANGSTGKVIVTTSLESDTSAGTFTYIVPPPPVTDSFRVRSDWDVSTDVSQGGLYNLSSVCTIDGATLSLNAAYSVPRSVMFRLRTTDPTCLSSKRSQLHISNTNAFLDTMNKYQFALYYPSSFVSDSREESHFTLNFNSLTTTPTLQLVVVNDKIYLRQFFDSNCTGTPITRTFFLANVVRNQWVVWTIQYDRSSRSNGRVVVYRNKTKLFDRIAPNFNGYSCTVSTRPIPAFGILKTPWMTTGRYTPTSRIIYLDAVKISGPSTPISAFLNYVK